MPYHDYSVEIQEQEIKDFIRTYEDGMVTIANLVARASDRWTAQEKKLFYLFVTKVNERDDENKLYLDKKSVADLLGVPPESVSSLYKWVKGVMDKSNIELSGSGEAESIYFIPYAKVKDGQIIVKFEEEAIKYLGWINNFLFTRFELFNILDLTYKSSISLYSYLASWNDSKSVSNHRCISMEEMYWALGLKQGQYTRKRKYGESIDVHMLTEKVLEPTKQDIDRANKAGNCDLHLDHLDLVRFEGGSVAGLDVAWHYTTPEGVGKRLQDVGKKKAPSLTLREKKRKTDFMLRFRDMRLKDLTFLSMSMGTAYQAFSGEPLPRWSVKDLQDEQNRPLISHKLCKDLMSRAEIEQNVWIAFEYPDLKDFLDTLECVNLAIEAQ